MRKFKEKLYKWVFAVLAFSCLVFLTGITVVLFKEGYPIFLKINLFDFMFGKSWYPTYDPPEFGILSLIITDHRNTCSYTINSIRIFWDGHSSAVFTGFVAYTNRVVRFYRKFNLGYHGNTNRVQFIRRCAELRSQTFP
jgi:phosphate transport system permease protein